jgi:hypothetical protein
MMRFDSGAYVVRCVALHEDVRDALVRILEGRRMTFLLSSEWYMRRVLLRYHRPFGSLASSMRPEVQPLKTPLLLINFHHD